MTRESPGARVAKFYGRLRLIRSVFIIFRVKICWNCSFEGLLHHPQLFERESRFGGLNFWNYIVWLRIADEGSVPEMHIMVHIVN